MTHPSGAVGEGVKMKYLWCITKDWGKPADGEKWHKAKSEETAATAGVRYIRKNTHHYVGSYLRFVEMSDGNTVVDFGNHIWFILIKKENTNESIQRLQ